MNLHVLFDSVYSTYDFYHGCGFLKAPVSRIHVRFLTFIEQKTVLANKAAETCKGEF